MGTRKKNAWMAKNGAVMPKEMKKKIQPNGSKKRGKSLSIVAQRGERSLLKKAALQKNWQEGGRGGGSRPTKR